MTATLTGVTETETGAATDTSRALVMRSWDLYRTSGSLPWTPELCQARQRLHDLLSPYADTLAAPLCGPGEKAVTRAYGDLTEVIARSGEAFMATGGKQ